MPPLARPLTLQRPDGPAVTADHALHLVDLAAFHEVVQHLEDAPRAGVERTLCEHLLAAARVVLEQQLLVHRPHAAEAGGPVHCTWSQDWRNANAKVISAMCPVGLP